MKFYPNVAEEQATTRLITAPSCQGESCLVKQTWLHLQTFSSESLMLQLKLHYQKQLKIRVMIYKVTNFSLRTTTPEVVLDAMLNCYVQRKAVIVQCDEDASKSILFFMALSTSLY